jgi:hypothetical protein
MAIQSKINPATIDVTYPIAGQDNNTQGFRTNFSTIYDCLVMAKTEITSLQNGIVAAPVITNIPITLTANGSPGEIAYSNEFLYVCITPNNWIKFPSTAAIGGAGSYTDVTGTSDVLYANFALAIDPLTDGMVLGIGAQFPNQTTAPTLNVVTTAGPTGPKSIYKNNNQSLSPGDIAGINHEMQMVYNAGTDSFTLINPSPMGTFATGNLTVAGTITTRPYTIGTLPPPAFGMRTFVTDGATVPTAFSAVSTTGTSTVPVFYGIVNGVTGWFYN